MDFYSELAEKGGQAAGQKAAKREIIKDLRSEQRSLLNLAKGAKGAELRSYAAKYTRLEDIILDLLS